MLQLSKFLLGGSAGVLKGSCNLGRLIKLLRGCLIDQSMVYVDGLLLRLEGLSLTLMCLELKQLVIKDSLLVWSYGLLTSVPQIW